MSVSVTNSSGSETDTFTIGAGGHSFVRNSSGVPYCVVENETEYGICVYKGNGTTPTSFSEQDASNNPVGSSGAEYCAGSGAIDGSDVIHIAYMYFNGKASQLRYVQFRADGTNDDFQNDAAIISDIGEAPSSKGALYCDIAVDSNGACHVFYTEYDKNGGTSYYTGYYVNNVGGSWNSQVEVEGAANSVECRNFRIDIDADNYPVLAYYNFTDLDIGSARGNANNATAFTLYDVESQGSLPSICVDGNKDTCIVYRQSTTLAISKHTYGQSWDATGFTETVSAITCQGPFCTPIDTICYVFYESLSDGDLYYYYFEDGSWNAGSELLDGISMADTRAKSSYNFNYDSTGTANGNNEVDVVYDDLTATNDIIWERDSSPPTPTPPASAGRLILDDGIFIGRPRGIHGA